MMNKQGLFGRDASEIFEKAARNFATWWCGHTALAVGIAVPALCISGCAGNPNSESAVAFTQAALGGPSNGPLVLGLAEPQQPSGGNAGNIALYSPSLGSRFPNSITSSFLNGDAVGATALDNNGTLVIAHGVGGPVGNGVLFYNQFGTSVSQSSLGIPENTYVPYSRNGAIALGDVSGDGYADVISATFDFTSLSSQVYVTVGNNAAPIPSSVTSALNFPDGGSLVVCDFDGDGVDDIIVAPSFKMYSGKNKTISNVPGVNIYNLALDKLACGDLNGDGFDDLIIGHGSVNSQGTPGLGSFTAVSALGHSVPSNFFASVSVAMGQNTDYDISAGDLDGDGVAELVVGHFDSQFGFNVNIFSAPGKTAPLSPLGSGWTGSKVVVPRRTTAIAPPTVTNIVVPYLLANIIYEPPGDLGSVNYTTGTTLGTTQTITMTSTTGVNLNVTVKIPIYYVVLSVNGGESLSLGSSTTTTNTFSTAETSAFNQRAASGNDVPDHSFDQYFMFFGIKGTSTDLHNGQPPTVELDMTTGTFTGGIIAAYLQELAQSQPLTLQDPTLKALVSTYITTPQDAAGLLALDPFFSGEDITQNPGRYAPFIPEVPVGNTTNTVQLPHPTGTNADGKPSGSYTRSFTGSSAEGTGHGTGSTATQTYSSSFGIDGVLTLGGSYAVSQSVTNTTTSGTTSSDSITLGTDHLCEQGSIALYRDMEYGGSFLTLQTLTNPCQQAPMKLMSFESLDDWQVQGGGSATLNGWAVSGAQSFSLSASPTGSTTIVSSPLSSTLLRGAATSADLSKVSIALNIPTQPGPLASGTARMYISSPTANVSNVDMGQVQLTGLPQGQFVRLGFTIPDSALSALSQDNPDVTFTLVLNANTGTSGWLVDDLQIGCSTCGACTSTCGQGTVCTSGGECGSLVCAIDTDHSPNGTCQTPTCAPNCGQGAACGANSDCVSQICTNGQCAPPACSPTCAEGTACGANSDCTSGVCTNGLCAPPACSPYCTQGTPCASNEECGSQVCTNGTCEAPACAPKCHLGARCGANTDCGSQVCVAGVCQAPACSPMCAEGAVCDANADCEAHICTNNVCAAPMCSPICGPGNACGANTECASKVCTNGLCAPPACSPHCSVGASCGALGDCATHICTGALCRTCSPNCSQGAVCSGNGDCASKTCTGGTCQQPSCAPHCNQGVACGANSDCGSQVCTNGLCAPPACSHQCAPGAACGVNADCASLVCTNNLCRAPSCSPHCNEGAACGVSGDCMSRVCTGGICRAPACSPHCATGAACGVNSECTSKVCNNGICR